MALFPCTAISPKQIQHTWSKGRMVDLEHDLLPGYIFLYFKDHKPEIGRFRSISGVIRCLSAAEEQHELTGSDEKFALMVLHNQGIIGKTKVYQEGQRIRICEGAFTGVSARIIKVDRRASRMMIEMPFANRLVKTWVEYEIVEADEREPIPSEPPSESRK